VRNVKAVLDLAESEFARVRTFREEQIASQSDFDQRRTQLDSARQQYDMALNNATQQYHSLQAAQARVALARKALADTVVRAPFAGLVAERLVSVGDYVTRGTKVAVVVRINPLRARLTVPEALVAAVGVGQPIALEVAAFPDRTFAGTIRYVSPALDASQRALTLEAVVPNADQALKPGMFATARIQQAEHTPALLVPASAVLTSSGTSRVYVIDGDHVEARVVTVGQTVDDQVEITLGLSAGERVATANVGQLADGMVIASASP
jgi:RND family efflux transporter MFP subunit